MSVLRPWVGKIEVYAVDLALAKHIRYFLGIHSDKNNVRKLRLLLLFKCADKHT